MHDGTFGKNEIKMKMHIMHKDKLNNAYRAISRGDEGNSLRNEIWQQSFSTFCTHILTTIVAMNIVEYCCNVDTNTAQSKRIKLLAALVISITLSLFYILLY